MLILKLLSIAFVSYLFALFVIKYAHKLRLLDMPNERSNHCSIIPTGAGIGFVSALFFGLFIYEPQQLIGYWYVFVAILMVFVIGILDDRHDVPPRLKFFVIFAAVLLMWINGLSIYTLGTWFGYTISLGWLALPFSMFAIAGFTNALNLIDGIDGLSASVSVVILGFFYFIGYEYNNTLMMVLSSFTIAGLIGFLMLNWNPAKVFMGDSGSLSIGFIISVLAVISIKYIHPIVILYVAAVPILDTLIVMLRRVRRGKSPFAADKTHMHHILTKFFLKHSTNENNNVKMSVLFLIILQLSFSGVGYLLSSVINNNPHELTPLLALMGFGVLFIVSYVTFTKVKKKQNLILTTKASHLE